MALAARTRHHTQAQPLSAPRHHDPRPNPRPNPDPNPKQAFKKYATERSDCGSFKNGGDLVTPTLALTMGLTLSLGLPLPHPYPNPNPNP